MAHQKAVSNLEEKVSFQQRLLALVKEVAEEESFTVERLDERYNKYYLPATKNGHRCVDGRCVLESYGDGSPTGYKNTDYRGDQFPGGTFGIIGALRVTTSLDEVEAREVVKKVCKEQGIQMGDHIDDGHGKIKTKEELEKRTRGCGNQDAAGDGKIPMYAGLVNREVIENRFTWLKENGGAVPVLTGEHREHLAAINLVKGQTFNTSEVVGHKVESIFNSDLMAVYELAGNIFERLASQGIQHQGPVGKKDFQKAMVKEVVRDYMQTLVALGVGNKLAVHADPQVQV